MKTKNSSNAKCCMCLKHSPQKNLINPCHCIELVDQSCLWHYSCLRTYIKVNRDKPCYRCGRQFQDSRIIRTRSTYQQWFSADGGKSVVQNWLISVSAVIIPILFYQICRTTMSLGTKIAEMLCAITVLAVGLYIKSKRKNFKLWLPRKRYIEFANPDPNDSEKVEIFDLFKAEEFKTFLNNIEINRLDNAIKAKKSGKKRITSKSADEFDELDYPSDAEDVEQSKSALLQTLDQRDLDYVNEYMSEFKLKV